jgi:glycine reductase
LIMRTSKTRVVHYLNQFFGGLGGEEAAGTPPEWFAGAKGPGRLLENLSDDLEIVATVVAGDNFMAERLADGVGQVIALIERHAAGDSRLAPDLLIAGPAFNAGRYGMACAALCQAVEKRLAIPAVTALFPENPAVADYRRDITIVRAADSVLGMREALAGLARTGLRRVRGEPISPADQDTIPRGLRQNYFAESSGAERAVEMLMKKLGGEVVATEYAMPVFDRVPPAPAVPNLSEATQAIVTSGGIVPRGNPDRIEAASASKYGAYSIEGIDRLSPASHQSVHGGYDPTYANADPNRVLPVDALRELEKAGRIGRLHHTYYATVGNATSVERAVRFGQEIAAILVNVGVLAVILTST